MVDLCLVICIVALGAVAAYYIPMVLETRRIQRQMLGNDACPDTVMNARVMRDRYEAMHARWSDSCRANKSIREELSAAIDANLKLRDRLDRQAELNALLVTRLRDCADDLSGLLPKDAVEVNERSEE